MRAFFRRMLSLWRRQQLDAELADEMSAHLEFAAADELARGLSSKEARRAAARKFGGRLQTVEAHRRVRTFPVVESIWMDATYAARGLRRQPAFFVVGLIVLTIVIGLNTSLFTLTAGLLFRPWAGVASPDRVVTIFPVDGRGRAGGFSIAESRFLAARVTSLSGVAVMRPESVDLGYRGGQGKIGAFLVSGNVFDLLGVEMVAGRGFRADEDRIGAPRAVVVLGYGLWQARLGGDAAVIGSSIRVNDVPFTVVGIAPKEFVGPEPRSANLFLPVAAAALLRPNDPAVASFLYRADDCCSDLVGRLAVDATSKQAARELELLNRSFQSEAGAERGDEHLDGRRIVVGGTEFLARPGRKNAILVVVALLSTGLLLVWLLACANIGNLQIARASARGREIGTRLALGASRARVVRQLLIEGLVLSLCAAALGSGLAYVLPSLLVRSLADGPAPFSLTPDAIVLFYAVVLACASSAVFGLAPALHATRVDVGSALRHTDGIGRSSLTLRNVLLGVQIAFSVILLVSAGLLVRSAQRRASFDPGFSTDAMAVTFQTPAAYDGARLDGLVSHLTDALGSSRGKFAFASREPLAMTREVTSTETAQGSAPTSTLRLTITSDYFDVLRIPLVAGRRFRSSERTSTVIINESLARLHWPTESAVGKTLLVEGPRQFEPREVVGVVRDAYTTNLTRVEPTVYGPMDHIRFAPALLVSGGTEADAANAVRIVAQFDPAIRVRTIKLAEQLSIQLQPFRYGAAVAATLGLSALALATIGTFGVFMYSVRQRTREIGIRVALGAKPTAVIGLILAGQTHALLWGLGAGIAGAAAASAVLRASLFGITPLDPVTYGGVVMALVVAGIAASYVPARRATSIDPATALRYE